MAGQHAPGIHLSLPSQKRFLCLFINVCIEFQSQSSGFRGKHSTCQANSHCFLFSWFFFFKYFSARLLLGLSETLFLQRQNTLVCTHLMQGFQLPTRQCETDKIMMCALSPTFSWISIYQSIINLGKNRQLSEKWRFFYMCSFCQE